METLTCCSAIDVGFRFVNVAASPLRRRLFSARHAHPSVCLARVHLRAESYVSAFESLASVSRDIDTTDPKPASKESASPKTIGMSSET